MALEEPLYELCALRVPGPRREVERRELRGYRERVHPGRRRSRVVRGLNRELEERLLRRTAALRVVVGSLQVVHRGRDIDDRLVVGLGGGPRDRMEIGQFAEGEVEIEGRRVE